MTDGQLLNPIRAVELEEVDLTEKLSFRAQVHVVDANIGVGHIHDRPAPFDTPDELLAEMHRHGVERAVIHHQHGEKLSPVTGNELLHAWLENRAGVFIPQWMAGPESDSLDQLQQLRASGQLTNVRIHDSGASGVAFLDWVYAEVLEWLQQERIPVWISLAETWDPTWMNRVVTPVAEIMDVLRAFPQIVAVLVGAHYTHSHYVRPFLKRPNTYIELSRYEVLRDLEALVEEFGAERFLYGSFYPRYAMGSMLYYIHSVGFDEGTLRALCAGNLERLLEGGTQ